MAMQDWRRRPGLGTQARPSLMPTPALLIQLAHMDRLDRPNIFGSMPLYIAASMRHIETIHTLIQLGASVELLNATPETPLMMASRHGYKDIESALIASGDASPHRQDTAGWTAMHHAVALGHAGTVQLLLNHGANVHERTSG